MTKNSALTVFAGAALAIGFATTPATAESPGAACLWAGGVHAQQAEIVAGGWDFDCGTDPQGIPQWFRGARSDRADTVPNPGAHANPTGEFSAGALQFGTDYMDYCVGSQLIPGVEDVFVAVPGGRMLYWKFAGPISQWRFENAAARPRAGGSASQCYHY
ncbi:hypothetical protein [Nocardia sp. NPDC051832]|uniref:hypothetical protein n=1 Tax=Nocardia sp. NPDC051832 TaxID=3155673 RepID=UPI00341A6998